LPTAAARRARVGPLYELVAGIDTVEELLAELARVATDEIDRKLSCGLTAQVEGTKLALASSDELAAALDRVQNDAGEGPCLKAMATATPVEINDPAEIDQWPSWRDEATKRGLRKSMSMPLVTMSGDVLGALNLYSISPGKFTDADRDAANVFAAHAAGALAVAIRLAQLAELTGHLEAALQSRAVIDQAKGILMAQQRCTADEAFAILRTTSQRRNIKLREIAAGIVARVNQRSPTGPQEDLTVLTGVQQPGRARPANHDRALRNRPE
jgi:GAF domain-containing protein